MPDWGNQHVQLPGPRRGDLHGGDPSTGLAWEVAARRLCPAVAVLPLAARSPPGGTPCSEPFSAQLLAYFLGLTGFRLDAAFSAITRSVSTHHGDKCHHLWDIRLSGHLSVLCLLPPTVFSWELLLSRGSLISSATCCPGGVTARNVKLCGGEAGK